MATNLMDSWGVDDTSPYGNTGATLDEDLVQDLTQKEAALRAKEGNPEQQPFGVEHIDYRITHLKQMVVCSGFIIMATDNGYIHRLHLSRPAEVEGKNGFLPFTFFTSLLSFRILVVFILFSVLSLSLTHSNPLPLLLCVSFGSFVCVCVCCCSGGSE
jgi:hypothetical protein